MEEYLSTGAVARICQVSAMTIAKWIDDGILRGHTTPGGHRRVAASDLVPFLKRHGMRVPSQLLQTDAVRILGVCASEKYLQELKRAFEAEPREIEFRGVTRGIDGLVIFGEWRPQVVVLDLSLVDVDGLQMCRSLAALEGDYAVRVVALSSDGNHKAQAAASAGAWMFVTPEDLLSDTYGIVSQLQNGQDAFGSLGNQK